MTQHTPWNPLSGRPRAHTPASRLTAVRLMLAAVAVAACVSLPAVAQEAQLTEAQRERLEAQQEQLLNQGMDEEQVQQIMEARRQAMLRAQAARNAQESGQIQRQPGEDRAPVRAEPIEAEPRENPEAGDVIVFEPFAEGVNLRQLVEYAADVLELNVSIDPSLTGSVGFNSGFTVRRDELLPLVNALLEQQGYMLTSEREGFIAVRRTQDVPVAVPDAGGFSTTRVIRAPNLKPSAIAQALQQQFAQGGQAATLRMSAFDDLGLLVVTDTPGRLQVIEGLVERIGAEQNELEFLRFELTHVAAPAARTRVIELVGGEAQITTATVARQAIRNQQQGNAGVSGTGVENFADRLRVDPQGNALIFRGRSDEAALVREALEVVDVPTTLSPKRYFTGTATSDIAQFARLQGLGEVTTVSSDGSANQQNTRGAVLNRNANANNAIAGLGNEPAASGGPILVVDPARGQIVYYGTPAQQAALQRVVDQFDPEAEQIVIREYKLEHADAEETADLLRELILMEDQTAQGGLLPGGQRGAQQNTVQPRNFANPAGGGLGDEAGFTGRTDEVLIAADIANNQLLVRAPVQQQDELRKIVDKIDVRRPQVYIDVKIVSISDSDEFRLAVETQLINAGGAGGLGQTNFGLTSAGDAITDLRNVATGLPGLTSALILSDQLPFVINAVQTVTDARILSNPTLLVDDNEEAEVISVRQEPTTQQSQGDNSTITSFQGFEDAGTELLVTPRISAGGYLRLNYNITLSNFVGAGTDGVPPPREERTIRADSVTIPGDATIVVGGINVRDVRSTRVKVPLLGDIPLLGYLFSDTRENASDSVLYVFITPRILNDRSFGGHRLISRGPRNVAELAPDIPPMFPEFVPMADARPVRPDPAGLDIDLGETDGVSAGGGTN